jgi:predicted SnoaL-like aldol condensation-catalyzing enzyme
VIAEIVDDTVSGHSQVDGPSDLNGLREFLDALAERGETMSYDCVHLLVGRGDLVAALSEGRLAGSPMAVIDLFRVADGMIVEHWDVIEEITPEETWVNSGKF